jgi:hypothetical protein
MATVKMVALAQYIASKAGATGLTVTCDVDEYNVDAATVNNAFLTAQSMTAVRNGIYRLFFDGDDTKLYTATAKTADSSVDQQHIAAVIVRLDRVNNADELTSTRLPTSSYSAAPSAASVADAVWDEALSGHATAGSAGAALSAAGGAADPLLNTVPGSYASGTAGYALGRIASGQLTVVQPVLADGFVRIVGGSTYKATIGTSIDVSSDGGWPTVPAGAAIKWVFGSLEYTGSRVDADTVRLELTAAQSAALLAAYPGRRTYDIIGTWPAPGSEVVVLANAAPCLVD